MYISGLFISIKIMQNFEIYIRNIFLTFFIKTFEFLLSTFTIIMKLFIWYLHFHKFNQVKLIKILNNNSIENENKILDFLKNSMSFHKKEKFSIIVN